MLIFSSVRNVESLAQHKPAPLILFDANILIYSTCRVICVSAPLIHRCGVHRRESWGPGAAVAKAATEEELNAGLPSSTRVAIENWAKQQKDSPPARRPFAARARLALDAMPCCYWNLWLSVSARMCIISCIGTHDTECGPCAPISKSMMSS